MDSMRMGTPVEPTEPRSQGAGAVPSPRGLLKKSAVVYGVMTVVGVLVMRFGHKSLAPAFQVPESWAEAARLVAIGGLTAGFLLVLSYFFEDWFASFRELKAIVMRYLGPCSVAAALFLSLITAFGEELLFRGAIQPFAGLVLTSVLFGLLHMGADGLVSAWSVWAFLAGLLLGWTFDQTGSLWPSIIAHFGVNAVSILNLRRAYRTYASEHGAPPPAAER
jgi:membrane protease YdiL (CAAX protease family)